LHNVRLGAIAACLLPLLYPGTHRPLHNPPTTLQAHLAKLAAVKTPLSAANWCSALARCPEVLDESPSVLQDRVNQLQQLMRVTPQQAAETVTRAPTLLQHDPQEVASKVRLWWWL
jgi:hypothetical protein